MQITQHCSSGDKTEVVVLVVVVIHTVLLVHPHFTLCLPGAALLRLPVPRLASTAPAATLRAWHPTTTAGSMAPASLSSENPNLELARGTQPSMGRARGRHLGLFRGSSAPFFCLTAGHALTKHSGSGLSHCQAPVSPPCNVPRFPTRFQGQDGSSSAAGW